MKEMSRGVSQILVGLDRVGIAGLNAALHNVDESGVRDREAVVRLMMESLEPLNYIPTSRAELYRVAFWREYLRHRGQPFSEWFSELPVVVRGTAGEERDQFVTTIRWALSRLELRPALTFEDTDTSPELIIHDELVARSSDTLQSVEASIRRRFSEW